MIGGYFLAQHFNIANFTPFFPNGLGGTLNGAAVIFFAFLGFNTIAMVSEETKNPQKTIPKAMIIAFIITFILYVAIGILEIGVLNWQALGMSASPLQDLAAGVSNNVILLDFVAFSALIATGSVVLSSIIGGARASFTMGRDRVLPRSLGKISNRFCTPYVSVIVGGLLIVVLAGIFYDNIIVIASIVNFGSLFTYLLTHLSLLKLRKSEPNTPRPFRVPLYPVIPIVGAISCIVVMYYLSINAMIASVVWFAVGLLIYFVMRRRMKDTDPNEKDEEPVCKEHLSKKSRALKK